MKRGPTGGPGRGGPPIYREVQHFRQWWLWVLVGGTTGVSAWGFTQQIILGRPFGQNPGPDWLVILIGAVFGLAFPVFFYAANLTTEVRPEGLYYRFFPLHQSFQRIPPEILAGFAPHTYSPLRDYGGWGIRYSSRGKAYNVSGNRGVMLELADGRRLLIGSRDPERLADAMGLAFGRKPGR